MEKIRLGKTNMMVSRIGLGGIPIQRLSEDEAVRVVSRCLDLGVTFIDTSHVYTTSEERIGKAIAGRREGLTIATKTISRTREGIQSDLNLSLERLGTDYIDLYQIHNLRDFSFLETLHDPNGPMVVLQEAKRSGVVKHIGFTSHALDVAKEAVKSSLFETVMVAFNFVNDTALDELLPLAREHGLGVIAMKPLAGGMLDNIAIAFKYLLGFPDVLPLVGIERTDDIEEIVQLVEAPWSMSEAEQHEMARIQAELGTRFCRNCDYCQPCPEGIQISSVLQARSSVKRYPPERIFTGIFGEIMEKVANCVKCGECETRCPYSLPISDIIKEEAEWFMDEKKRFMEQYQL